MQERYSRNYNTLTRDEQIRLKRSRVCIVGLGGLGGSVAEMLARTGIGSLVLVDGDCFESSNLNRQILCTEKLMGVSKARAARERIKEINSSVDVKAVQAVFDLDNGEQFLENADLAIDCLDSVSDRFLLQEVTKSIGIPLVSGAIAGTCGQVTTIFPEDTGMELIYGKKEAERSPGAEILTGNLSYCALCVASIQSSETVKVLLDRGELLRNRLFIVDLMTNSFDIIGLI